MSASAEVPTQEAFLVLSETVALLSAQLEALPEPIVLTAEEKAAIQTVIALINRLVGGT